MPVVSPSPIKVWRGSPTRPLFLSGIQRNAIPPSYRSVSLKPSRDGDNDIDSPDDCHFFPDFGLLVYCRHWERGAESRRRIANRVIYGSCVAALVSVVLAVWFLFRPPE